MKAESIAIVPGSFDPITNGHLAIIKKASQMYDKVYIAVMINESKKYMFSLDERLQIAKSGIDSIDNVCVISSDGMLWELAKQLDACAIVKGYRNQIDIEYEQKMADFNEAHFPKAKTVLIKSEEDLTEVSSTVVREHINKGIDFRRFVPSGAYQMINMLLSQRK